MDERPPRKRIPITHKARPAVIDTLEFKKNKCSENARAITAIEERLNMALWYDKHYHDRHQHGDEDGKRNGIEPAIVEKLIRKSIKYLLLFSSISRGFKFINFKDQPEPPVRVILQEFIEGYMLNVVIETHFTEISEYEITVKTAMCADDFRIASGQYAIEFQEHSCILKRCDNKRTVEIYSF